MSGPDLAPLRNLIVILGDQLSRRSAAFEGFDVAHDIVWMAEAREEIEHVWSSKLRVAVFLSAMRHFREELARRRVRVCYTEMQSDPSSDRGPSLGAILAKDAEALSPQRIVMMRPGDHRVLTQLEAVAKRMHLQVELREDRHFFGSPSAFAAWADEHPGLLQEAFYEGMRKSHGILLDSNGKPEGGRWSLDVENRKRFSDSSGSVPRVQRHPIDSLTRSVLVMVEERFRDHPGSTANFDFPLTRRQALAHLRDFLDHRLALFGPYEDAMWSTEPVLFHSRLSLPLNLKLLTPKECIDGAIARYRRGSAGLSSVEGFVRQILGWREFVRGVYWRFMPEYADRNALGCGAQRVPNSFWDGNSEMNCIRTIMQSLLSRGYAHHIQRLMVLGNFALLLGVHPRRFHEWHMAMYVDAVDWVSLPNSLGMSQYGDGGIVGTKPYAASANYIRRMSNYCDECRYDPRKTTGKDACPFNALYWDFLARHRKRFAANARMNLTMRNLERKREAELRTIRTRARSLRERIHAGERI